MPISTTSHAAAHIQRPNLSPGSSLLLSQSPQEQTQVDWGRGRFPIPLSDSRYHVSYCSHSVAGQGKTVGADSAGALVAETGLALACLGLG